MSPDILKWKRRSGSQGSSRDDTPQCTAVDNDGVLNFFETDGHVVDVDRVEQEIEVLSLHLDHHHALGVAGVLHVNLSSRIQPGKHQA